MTKRARGREISLAPPSVSVSVTRVGGEDPPRTGGRKKMTIEWREALQAYERALETLADEETIESALSRFLLIDARTAAS